MLNIIRIFIFCCWFFALLPAEAQTGAEAGFRKHLIYFQDKDNSPYSLANPQSFLSERALNRRQKQQIALTRHDLPVNPAYVSGLKSAGAQVWYTSRWFNAAVVYCDSTVLGQVLKLNFVKNGQTLNRRNAHTVTIHQRGENIPKKLNRNNLRLAADRKSYGLAYNQANMIGAVDMHAAGFRGEGMHVAIFDGGFPGVNQVPAFAHLFNQNRLKATFDFVDRNIDVFEKDTHGTHVLSTMAAYQPGTFIGTAPQANYYLFITEDSRSEHNIEEINWLLAAEYADSAGVDVINSSLGYTTFDPPSRNYSYQDLNGRTSLITRAADFAAATGILVINSAGNEGNKPWRYIGAPADGDSVLSIGAVDSLGRKAPFSSFGPTADGRIKPDLVAQGVSAAIITPSGNITRANGTSFSGPILSGMAVGFWQANPNLTNMQVINYLRRTASQANKPDNLLGYGLPNFIMATALATEEDQHALVFPNPVQNNQLQIKLGNEFEGKKLTVVIYNMIAQKVSKETIASSPVDQMIKVDVSNLPPGMYSCMVISNDNQKAFKFLKTDK